LKSSGEPFHGRLYRGWQPSESFYLWIWEPDDEQYNDWFFAHTIHITFAEPLEQKGLPLFYF